MINKKKFFNLSQLCFFNLVRLSLFMLFLKINKTAVAGSEEIGELEGFSTAYQPQGVGGSATLTKILSNILGVLTIVGGLIFIIQFVLGALNWISSSGKPEKIQKAQDKMINAGIGFIAVVAAYGLAFIVGKVLGVNILDPASYITDFWK